MQTPFAPPQPDADSRLDRRQLTELTGYKAGRKGDPQPGLAKGHHAHSQPVNLLERLDLSKVRHLFKDSADICR